MQRRKINRGGIISAGYDRVKRTLDVEFDTKRVVRYTGVGEEIANRFLSASSPRSYLTDTIEDEYTSIELTQSQAKSGSAPKKSGVPDELKKLFGG